MVEKARYTHAQAHKRNKYNNKQNTATTNEITRPFLQDSKESPFQKEFYKYPQTFIQIIQNCWSRSTRQR